MNRYELHKLHVQQSKMARMLSNRRIRSIPAVNEVRVQSRSQLPLQVVPLHKRMQIVHRASMPAYKYSVMSKPNCNSSMTGTMQVENHRTKQQRKHIDYRSENHSKRKKKLISKCLSRNPLQCSFWIECRHHCRDITQNISKCEPSKQHADDAYNSLATALWRLQSPPK